MTEQELTTFDRKTSGAWRIGTSILWCLGALVVAVAMSFAATSLFYDVLDAAIDPFTGGAVVPEPITLIGSALLVGGSIGLVIGSRVHRARIWIAGIVAALYLSSAPFPFMTALRVGYVWRVLGIASYVLAATGVAWLFERRTRDRGQMLEHQS